MMKECIKSYHVFLSPFWLKCVMYVIYPVLLTLGTWGLIELTNMPAFSLVYCIGLLMTAEVFLDFFVFGGVAAKDTNKLEYLKTSVKGLSALRKALLVDEARRLISVVLIISISLMLSGAQMQIVSILAGMLLAIIFTEIGLFVIRKTTQMTVLITVLFVGEMVAMAIVTMTIMYMNISAWVLIPLVIMVGVLVVGNIKMVMKKARDSYYDDRNQKKSEAD